jgi:transposase InsO family protein
MAKMLGVSSGAYYRRAACGLSEKRAKDDAELVRLIRGIAAKHLRRYGSPRVRQELRRVYGKRVSRKKAARLMRENGLNARIRRSFVRTAWSNHGLPVCPNILNREFHAEQPGQKRVSGITCLRTLSGWLYLTAVIGLADRKIAGWSFSASLRTENTVTAALRTAVTNRPPAEGLIFHSGRGVQYCAASFRDTLTELCPAVRQSMSWKGNCWDNACAESFFKTLKRELETLDGKHTEAEVRQTVFLYIEAYYNRVRLHSALDYCAPHVFSLELARASAFTFRR